MPSSLFPTLGILGDGQLGRMMAQAAIRMGMQVKWLAPNASGPMNGLGEGTVGDWHDPEVLRSFAEGCTVITVESEWAPAEHMAEVLPGGTTLWPSPDTLFIIRNKGRQKTVLAYAGLPVPDFKCCATLEDALETARGFGYPCLLKQFRGSYDGYGNATVERDADVRAAWADLADEDGLLVEAWAPFVRELAVQVARQPDGAHVVYPVAYTEQRDHRCHAVIVPAGIPDEVEAEARRIGLAAVEAVGGVGLTAVELFELEDGRILVNELAPRPHNTGHYSIEGSHTSQFENHVRAVLGWPLGDPGLRAPAAVMVNVLGQREGMPETSGLHDALSYSDVAVHIYGKTEVRPRRKMGHVTATGSDPAAVRQRAEEAAALIVL